MEGVHLRGQKDGSIRATIMIAYQKNLSRDARRTGNVWIMMILVTHRDIK
jgi:hypothetical protein